MIVSIQLCRSDSIRGRPLVLSSHITSYHMISYHLISYHTALYHVILFPPVPLQIMSHCVKGHHVMLCYVISCLLLSIYLHTYRHYKILFDDLLQASINLVTHSPIGNCWALCASSLYRPKIDAAPSGEMTPKYPPESIWIVGDKKYK